MSQTPQIFPASIGAKRRISRMGYLLFIAGAVLLACGLTALVVSLGVTPGAAEQPVQMIPVLSAGVACAGVAGLIAAVATLLQLRLPIQVEATPYRLTWREGRRIATLDYEEVVRVDLVRSYKTLRDGQEMVFPVVRFVEDDGEVMEFEISFDDRGMVHQARFDARAITGAVLPHLQQRAVISDTVQEFVATGTVDIDALPER